MSSGGEDSDGAGHGLALRVSAVVGLLGVLLGAFGAHGLEARLEANGTMGAWETAVFYQLVHAVVLWVLAMHGRGGSPAWWCFFAGVVSFSGGIYLVALKLASWAWPLAPVGGVLLMVGWGILILAGRRTG
ncbi:MAG: DUF423 domain-containing protein [Verrucomicrobiota bacterium]